MSEVTLPGGSIVGGADQFGRETADIVAVGMEAAPDENGLADNADRTMDSIAAKAASLLARVLPAETTSLWR